MKQRSRIGIFQSDDRSADCLLRQVQGFGRTCHVLAFGDSDEDAQLLQSHAVFIALMSKPARAPASRRAGAPLWNPLCSLSDARAAPEALAGPWGGPELYSVWIAAISGLMPTRFMSRVRL